jgi:hypothetical protein
LTELLVFFYARKSYVLGRNDSLGLALTLAHTALFVSLWSTSSSVVVRSPQMAHAGSQGQAFVWAWVCAVLFKNRECLLETVKGKTAVVVYKNPQTKIII